MPTAVRFPSNPLITLDSHPNLGTNVNGPSVIRVPDWVQEPLGRYYLYFAHHQGDTIRMAYADQLEGPWTVFAPGVLHKHHTPYEYHIASPDVHVDHASRRIWMVYHGDGPGLGGFRQKSSYADSKDGLLFTSRQEMIDDPYHRLVHYHDHWYYFSGGSRRRLYRSREPAVALEAGPILDIEGVRFTPPHRMRHVALDLRGDHLDIYFSSVADTPERILACTVDLHEDWLDWEAGPVREVLKPEYDYEGAGEELVPSVSGSSHVPVHELRDPCIFNEGENTYLFYSIAGEQGIGGAVITA